MKLFALIILASQLEAPPADDVAAPQSTPITVAQPVEVELASPEVMVEKPSAAAVHETVPVSREAQDAYQSMIGWLAASPKGPAWGHYIGTAELVEELRKPNADRAVIEHSYTRLAADEPGLTTRPFLVLQKELGAMLYPNNPPFVSTVTTYRSAPLRRRAVRRQNGDLLRQRVFNGQPRMIYRRGGS